MSESEPRRQLRMRNHDLSQLPMPEVPSGYTLRNWQAGDEVALAGLLGEAFAPSVWTAERVLETLPWCEGIRSESIFILLGPGGDVAGTATAWDNPKWPQDGYLHYVAVSSAHRGRNLGTVVSLAALDYMRSRGRRRAVIETDDFRLAALETYFRLGFVPIADDAEMVERWRSVCRALGREEMCGPLEESVDKQSKRRKR